ncbi:BatD family protein [Sulfurimonas autotrophica]|uniref:Uncharacterized protein n=1 Tax=Sulfurimonas autotrophica (strain ATCC BAA-671 / DSM 16294 / JCM 11897 / OK10) TaxID=563040 RepID=E0UPD4_SULAO|nr:BatD family protein [Sulfurimonas autotrophica]ADN09664.1 hypothetical protein Saut_1617 [Sulfurimonas autotrophica DSM 16294]
MKNTLGKAIFLFMLFGISLLGSTQLASYKLTTNKKSVHTKEPLLITFTAKQKNHSDNMFFSFNVPKSPDYEVKLLHKTIQDNGYHNTITTFEYILFALKEETLHVNFDFIIRTASDKAVKQSYVDDHDDSIAISTYDTKVKIRPLTIKVKKLSKDVDLVGDFRLNSQIDTTEIDQYGAVNLHYILSGKGYKEPQLNLLRKQIKNVTIFSKIKNNISKLTEEGYIINTEYIYALTSKEDFRVPALALEVYSPTKNRYYTLHTKAYTIKVKKIDTTVLIDKTNAPKANNFVNIEAVKKFFIYALLFLSGFLAAKLSEKSFIKREKKEEFKDIKNAKSVKELLTLLIMHYQDKGLDEYIFKLEDSLNNKQPLNLNKIKKEIVAELT